MKRWLVILVVLLIPLVAWGEEDITGTGEVFVTAPTFYPFAGKTWTLSITDDGQISFNDKPIERMSDPELKSIMLEIRDALVRQNENGWCDRQTTYLLEELEECQKQVKGGVK